MPASLLDKYLLAVSGSGNGCVEGNEIAGTARKHKKAE